MESGAIAVPVVIGWLRPAIILPRGLSTQLSGPKRDAVLVHELAHVRRGDYGWQLLLLLLQAIYWPQPLVWLAGRCMGRVRERACDDVCIYALGGRDEYRATLLDLARALVRPHRLSLGLAAVRSSKIARRLAGIDTSAGSARCQASRTARWSLAATTVGLAIVMGASQLVPPASAQQTDEAGRSQSSQESPTKVRRAGTAIPQEESTLTGTVLDSDGQPVVMPR
jgi:beta-lactamase regulating signal transducer with metallopeptidase domain